MIMHDCPMCGLKESSYGDTFCGKCEAEYQSQNPGPDVRLCLCEDGCCHQCVMDHVRLLESQGRYAEANQFYNM